MRNLENYNQLHYAYATLPLSAKLKQTPEDFRVEERLKFTPKGEGEHVYVLVEKTLLNTEDVKNHLARCAKVNPRQVSYAGLKDKHATTQQWFSIHLPKSDFDIATLEGLKICEVTRHEVKLRRTMVLGNRFHITLRELQGNSEQLDQRLKEILQQGVPNYYAEQRLSTNNKNVQAAINMFTRGMKVSRFKRGLFLSAARSYLFNLVLSERIRQGSWGSLLQGEAVILDGTRSFFVVENMDATIQKRLDEWDIHPSGPLWGRGEIISQSKCAALEKSILHDWLVLTEGLENAGLKQERRALRMRAQHLQWQKEADCFRLSFELASGQYATALLRECLQFSE